MTARRLGQAELLFLKGMGRKMLSTDKKLDLIDDKMLVWWEGNELKLSLMFVFHTLTLVGFNDDYKDLTWLGSTFCVTQSPSLSLL